MTLTRRRALAGLGAFALAGCAERAQDLRPRWPGLQAQDLQGQPVVLPSTAPRVRLINFWALWCPPCRRELPSLERLAQLAAPMGIQVSAVAIADNPFAIREYLLQNTPALQSVVVAPGTPSYQALALEMLPQTFLIAPDSHLIGRWTGAREWDEPLVLAELRRLAQGG